MRSRALKLDARYGERWDHERRALAGPMPAEEARRCHAAGEPYAVLLGRPERPRVLLEVEWLEEELIAWCFDEQLRRTVEFEFRVVGPGRMGLVMMLERRFADVRRPETDGTAPSCATTFGKDGEPRTEAYGASDAGFRVLDRNDRWFDVPRFGEWAPLAAFLLGTHRHGHRPIVRPARCERPAPSGTGWLWEPAGGSAPGALRPGPECETAFGPPARYRLRPDGGGTAREVAVETRSQGLLSMPTGRFVVADTDGVHEGLEPFTVVLPPGEHPVTMAVARFPEEPGRARRAHDLPQRLG